MADSKNKALAQSKNLALELILLLGMVSAFGDITYETARSVTGPYLAFLGASAFVVGTVSGLGEFLGYALHLVSGFVAARTRLYWLATFIGYGSLVSIPLLALTNHWQWAVVLLLIERVGKAIRTPSRDTILSHATKQIGRGWGFGIHEALDQIGAIVGPILFSIIFIRSDSYKSGFSMLWIPAVLTMVSLTIARLRIPDPEKLEGTQTVNGNTAGHLVRELPRIFWIYGLFTFLGVAGFINFQIISLRIATSSSFTVGQIPILYAVAMAVDAVAALVIGKIYDKIGLRSLGIIPLITMILPFLFFLSDSYWSVIIGVVLWGMVMAFHETIMRASIADITSVNNRAFAYGIFNVIYGAAWFVSGITAGLLFNLPKGLILIYVLAMEVFALIVFTFIRKRKSIQ